MAKTIKLQPEGYLVKFYCDHFKGALAVQVPKGKGKEDAAKLAERHFRETHPKHEGAPVLCALKCTKTCNHKMQVEEIYDMQGTNLQKFIPEV